jgi:hypothetical protein
MASKTEAEKALDAREKELDARQKDLDKRESALNEPKEEVVEDLTPSPTQAENDEAKLALGRGATYTTRDAQAD